MLLSAILTVAMIFSLAACAPTVDEGKDPVADIPADDNNVVTPDVDEPLPEVGELITPNVGTASDSNVNEEPAPAPLVDPTPATEGLKFQLNDEKTAYYVFRYTGTASVVYVPFAYNGLPVVEIGYRAFDGAVLTSVTLPDTIEYINQYAFRGTTLASIEIPASVTNIADLAFMDNPNLASITVDESNPNYRVVSGCLVKGDTVVLGCKSSTIPTDADITAIGSGAFRGSGIEIVNIPSNIVKFGRGIFVGCTSLRYAGFYDTIALIEDGMFTNCSSLANVVIPDSVTYIGARSFQGCSSLTEMVIPSNVVTVGQYAFENSGLTSVTMKEGVTTIGGAAFKNCSRLISVVVPDSVVTIGASAFWECRSLSDISLGVSSASRLIEIGGGSFYNCSALKMIFIPKTVTQIGASTFQGCTYSSTDEAGVTTVFTVYCESSGYLNASSFLCGAKALYKQTRP